MDDGKKSKKRPERQTLSVAEAGVLLGVGRNSAFRAARLGQIPTIRVGRRLLVPRAGLQRMLDAT